MPIAIYFSQYVLCDNKQNGQTCGTCPSCLKMNAFTHPDVHFVFPTNRNKSLKSSDKPSTDKFINELRTALIENPYLTLNDWYAKIDIENKQGFIGEEEAHVFRKKLAVRPYEGKYSIFIVWHADLMNEEFGNKILKSLEEPSEQTLIILTSEHQANLLKTITSRVQTLLENQVSSAELTRFLTEAFDVEPERAAQAAYFAEGNVQNAILEALDLTDHQLEQFRDWMRSAFKADILELSRWSERMAGRSREEQKTFVYHALKILDRCFRMGWIEMPFLQSGEDAEFYKKFSPFVNAANVEGLMNLLDEAGFHIERNLSPKIVWMDASIKATRLIHTGKKSASSSSSNSN